MFSGVAMGGAIGAVRPGGEIEGIATKNWEEEKHLGGEILGRAFK